MTIHTQMSVRTENSTIYGGHDYKILEVRTENSTIYGGQDYTILEVRTTVIISYTTYHWCISLPQSNLVVFRGGGHNRVTAESRKMHLTMCSTTIVDQLLFYRCTTFLFKKNPSTCTWSWQSYIVKFAKQNFYCEGKINFSHQISILLVLLIPKRYNTWVSDYWKHLHLKTPLRRSGGFQVQVVPIIWYPSVIPFWNQED